MSSFLPPEIVANILSRLPVKPLLRFRCVSKSWCSSIDSPDFAKMHLNQSIMSKSNRNLMLGFRNVSLHSVEFRSFYSPGVDSIGYSERLELPIPGSSVSNSCNGLSHMFIKKPKYTDHYIWNPFTRKYMELPTISFDFQGLSADIEFTLLDKHGFAYISETDEYMVLQVMEIKKYDLSYMGNHQAYIFSSRWNEWERLEPFPYQILPTTAYDAHLNGALHTVVTRGSLQLQWALMVFDTRSKKHSMLPRPGFTSRYVDVSVEVLEGNLCLLRKRVMTPMFVQMDIWVMKDYGVEDSWFKLLSVALEPYSIMTAYPLAYSEDGAEVLMNYNRKELVWYNLRSKSVRKVAVNVLPLDFFAEVSFETLVSLPGFISKDDSKAKSQDSDDVSKPSQQKMLKEKGNTSSTKAFLSQGFKLKL